MYEDRKRQLAFELGRRPGEDEVPTQFGAIGEFGEHARLADARLADQLDCSRQAALELIEQLLERVERVGAPHERILLVRWSRRDLVRHRASFGRYRTFRGSRRVRHP
jgi:hypothetical protein